MACLETEKLVNEGDSWANRLTAKRENHEFPKIPEESAEVTLSDGSTSKLCGKGPRP